MSSGNIWTRFGVPANITTSTGGDWSTAGSNLHYDTGNIGIGTPSPGNKLTIDGTAPIAEIRSGGYLMMRPTANNWDYRLQATGTQLDILSGSDLGNPKMSILNNGNVGIGMTNPKVRLDFGQTTTGWMRGSGVYIEDHDGSFGKQARLYNYGETFAVSREAADVGGYEAQVLSVDLNTGNTAVAGTFTATSVNAMKSYIKGGNNGTASCEAFCQNVGNVWGTDHGSCLGAKAGDNSRYYNCTDVPGTGVGGGQMPCLCTTF